MTGNREGMLHRTQKQGIGVQLLAPFQIQWSELNRSEQVIGLAIALCPVLWFIGWNYVMVFFVLGLLAWHYRSGHRLQLTRPSWVVFFALAYQVYRNVIGFVVNPDVTPKMILAAFTSLSFCFLLWYIESNRIRVRPKVAAWGLLILAVEMVLFWVVAQGVFGAPMFLPPRTLFAQLTAKGEVFVPGMGNTNYLIPYWFDDFLPGGFARFSFFFPYPEDFALIAGLMGLVARDAKGSQRTTLLFGASIFLLFLSGTRSNWLVFPIILGLRYLIQTTQRRGGTVFLFALIAAVSFTLFSIPGVIDDLADSVANFSQSTGNMRQDSTEVRSLIYQRTWEEILNEPDYRLWLGRGEAGETVLPGYAPAQVGSHSFLLGSLLYRLGLVGTGLFFSFWVGLIGKIYQTRQQRPLCALLMLLYLSLTFITMDVSTTNFLVLLISVMSSEATLHRKKQLSYALG
jgi:hypothetical protein